MDRYCVVISGLRAGVTNADAWAPVAAALKLDEAAFAQRVLAALPLIVHQHLDQAAADHLTTQLQAMQIDARTWPDDEQLVYLQRDGTSRGPLPLSALATFIEPGEAYRLRGHAEWQEWAAPAPASDLAVPTAVDLADDEELSTAPDTASAAPVETFETAEPADDESAWEPAASDDPSPPPSSEDAEFTAPVHDFDDAKPLESESAPAESDLLADDTSSELLSLHGIPPLPPGDYTEPAAPADDADESSLIDPESAADGATLPGDEADTDAVPPAGRSKLKVALVCLLLLAIIIWFLTSYQSQEPSPPSQEAAPAPAATVTHAVPPSAAPAPATSAADHPAVDAKNAAVAPAAAASTATLAANASPSMTEHCADHAPGPKTPEEVSLLANGRRHLTGRALRTGAHGEIYVVEAALGYEGMCRPNPYQIYVFRGGQLTGTLSVDPMLPRSDGAITNFKALDPDHLQIEIAHYQPTDPLCCPSSHETRVIALSRFGEDFPAAAAATPAARQRKK